MKKEGKMSIAEALKEAGKISNKDTEFISNYIRHVRRELIENALTFRSAAANIDTICGELNGLRIMVDRLFKVPESITAGEKLFVRATWDLPVGSKVRNAFDKIERKVLESLLSDDETINRSEHAKELTIAIEKALEEQKELITKQNKILKEETARIEKQSIRWRGKNEAAEEIQKALHLDKKK